MDNLANRNTATISCNSLVTGGINDCKQNQSMIAPTALLKNNGNTSRKRDNRSCTDGTTNTTNTLPCGNSNHQSSLQFSSSSKRSKPISIPL
jgi:hypothetical protein